jgi:hypothetical protein
MRIERVFTFFRRRWSSLPEFFRLALDVGVGEDGKGS